MITGSMIDTLPGQAPGSPLMSYHQHQVPKSTRGSLQPPRSGDTYHTGPRQPPLLAPTPTGQSNTGSVSSEAELARQFALATDVVLGSFPTDTGHTGAHSQPSTSSQVMSQAEPGSANVPLAQSSSSGRTTPLRERPGFSNTPWGTWGSDSPDYVAPTLQQVMGVTATQPITALPRTTLPRGQDSSHSAERPYVPKPRFIELPGVKVDESEDANWLATTSAGSRKSKKARKQ